VFVIGVGVEIFSEAFFGLFSRLLRMTCTVKNRANSWHCEILGFLGLEIGIYVCMLERKLVTKEVYVELLQTEPLLLTHCM